jgi:chloride channel 3/4/5
MSTFTAEGLAVGDLEERLSNTAFKGFPVISADGRGTLLGYIERTEIRWVIGEVEFVLACPHLDVHLDKTAKMRDITPDTPCSFVSGRDTLDELPSPTAGIDDDAGLIPEVSGPAIGIEESVSMGIIENTSSGGGGIQLWPWVNTTPLTVSPQLPLEIVMQLFQRMG